ncbi:DUF397 domain-containing protein [Kitasatospora sp. NPDC051984]|uniref:DUF397 domain-containing protein n=1 Tax=Kitasatospora sp. NPDC051984 TaxID=3364059 RepID=UPI0037C6BEE3
MTDSNVPVASSLPVVWRKAAKSNPNDDCVECGTLDGTVAVRDSKDPDGPAHIHAAAAFEAFVTAAAHNTLAPVA